MPGKIAITGSNGYIGAHLKNRLKKDYEIIEIGRGNSLDTIEGCEAVYHLASNVRMTEKIEWEDIHNDLKLTIDILDKCVEYNVRSLIFSSSGGSVYKPNIYPVDELCPTEPMSPYGILKITIEGYILFYASRFPIKCTILRISNPYGGDTNKGVVSALLKALANNIPFELVGDGSCIRDFIYIDDLIDALELVLHNKIEGIYNVGTGIGTSINDLIGIIQRSAGKELICIKKPKRKTDSPVNILNCNKIMSVSNWKARVTLNDGIKKVLHI